MTDKEYNLRIVLFLVIGILLLLSLFICVFIVMKESDLVEVEAEVANIEKNIDGTDESEISVIYDTEDGQDLKYYYRTKNTDIKINDKVIIYYHAKNTRIVQRSKTSKWIFVCPVIGLVICGIGLFELAKNKSKEQKVDYKTSVIGVVGDTKQLKIITDGAPVHEYEKTPEEIAEAQVKTIKKELENIKPVEPIVIPKKAAVQSTQPVQQAAQAVQPATQPVENKPASVPVQQPTQPTQPAAQPTQVASAPANAPKTIASDVIESVVSTPRVQPQKELSVPKAQPRPVETAQPQPAQPAVQAAPAAPQPVENKPAPAPVQQATKSTSQNEIVNKIQEAAKNNPSLGEEDIKNMIKDVLKEVISEVQVDKKPDEPVVQRRVLPNYFYISGTSLIYEEPGREAKEISLKTIKSVTRTINSEGVVVKLVVSNDEIKCILTNMKNIDLEQVANLLHNKMSTIDENFNEVIEHKEY